MGENPNKEKKEVIDPELEAARRSMGNRIDQDAPIETEEKKPEEPEENKVIPPTIEEKKPEAPVVPVVEPPKVEEGDKDPDLQISKGEKKPIKRPETYIPMPKYLSEKEEWEKTEEANKTLKKRVEELESLGRQNNATPENKSDAIKAFAEKHGYDEDFVKDLLGTVQSQLLPDEKLAKIDEATKIVEDRKKELEESQSHEIFKTEFADLGLPKLKEKYPNATPEQLEAARIFLDGAAHSKPFHDKPLGYVIYEHEGELSKIFTSEVDAPVVDETTPIPPQSKKTMESGKNGQGRANVFTAEDFKGKTDFTELLDLDPGIQESIRKGMDNPTYESYMKFLSAREKGKGVEVMRNGQKVILK